MIRPRANAPTTRDPTWISPIFAAALVFEGWLPAVVADGVDEGVLEGVLPLVLLPGKLLSSLARIFSRRPVSTCPLTSYTVCEGAVFVTDEVPVGNLPETPF